MKIPQITKIIPEAVVKKEMSNKKVSGKVDVSNFTSFNKLIKLADKFFVEKNYKQSLDKYNKAIELDSNEPLYLNNRANAYYNNKEYEVQIDMGNIIEVSSKDSGYLTMARADLSFVQ